MRRWTSSNCCASFATRKQVPNRTLGLSQADDRLRAGDRCEAVEWCSVRGCRKRGLLSRRSLHDSDLVARHEPDLLDQKQTSLTNRFTMFGRENRWRHEGDHRFQWTSLETYGLGTSADTTAGVQADFNFFRLYHTSYYRLRPALYAGAGLYFDNHTDVGPRSGEDSTWTGSPDVEYSESHGLPLDSQTAAGTSLDLLWDNRDSFINADRGWLAEASYRTLFDGFLGGDSTWQKLTLDLRTYASLSRERRHRLAFWWSPISSSEEWRRFSIYLQRLATRTAAPPADTPKASSAASGSPTGRSSIGRR